MDNRNNSRFSPPAVGGVSLLVAFAVLCLTVFALLALATVQADARLAGASAQAVADYYAADCQAQELLARLKNGELPDNVYLEGEHYVFDIPVSESQTLEVELDRTLTVLRWQTVSAKPWQNNETLDLWEGDGIYLGIDTKE